MEKYRYKPWKFYCTAFAATWFFWMLAIIFNEGASLVVFMLMGLLAPATVAVITVFTSGSNALKKDFKRKLVTFYRVNPFRILLAIIVFALIVCVSILISLLFGGSTAQFSFTEDFSFSIGGTSALLTILLASVIEEIGWRGYGEDAIAAYHSWFKESIIFGILWACWHLPLFWVPGTYHFGLREMGIGYMLNFLLSVTPMGFITTWVYVKSNRSMLASIIFHLFINTMQEKIAMTPETKIIESFVVTIAAIIIVVTNREMFFEKTHIGHMLDDEMCSIQ